MRKMIWIFYFSSCIWISLFSENAYSQKLEPKKELRAIWVTRWEYKSPRDIINLMDNLAATHFNTVLFQVRGNATTFYASDIEPWANELGQGNPGWDPLALALQAAHDRGLKLYVWVNVGPGWRGQKPPTSFNQLWNRHPQWFARDLLGNLQSLNSHYVWLALTNPEVRRYLARVVTEIFRKYHPDGIHFDYIRFPGPGVSFDPISLQEFRKNTGGSPQDFPSEWDQFRRESITSFLKLVRDSLSVLGNHALISAAVWRNHAVGKNVFMQDAHTWLNRGLVDLIFPMLYTQSDALFLYELNRQLQTVGRQSVIPGINPGQNPQTLEQIRIARQLRTPGHAIFSYSALFPKHKPDKIAKLLRKQFYLSDVRQPAIRSAAKPIIFRDVFTWPRILEQKQPFFVYCEYQTERNAPIKAFIDWKNPLPSVPMIPMPGQPNILLSERPIFLSDSEQWLEFRIGAISHQSPSDSIFSEWQHIPVAQKSWQPDSVSFIGKPMGGAQFIASDKYGHLWIPAWWDNKIYIIEPDGTPLPFSPITAGLDANNRAVKISRPAGITSLKGDTILVVGDSARRLLFRYSAQNGLPLAGIPTPFVPYDLASSDRGEVFATEAGKGTWYHFYLYEDEGKNRPVGGDHLLRGIAVSPDGLTVYATCQTDGTVHQWQRLNPLSAFSQVPDLDVEALSIGCVDTDGTGNVYISHTGNGFVTVFSREGVLSYVLKPNKPLLRAPRGVAVTPQGIFITQMGGTTRMPVMRLSPPLP